MKEFDKNIAILEKNKTGSNGVHSDVEYLGDTSLHQRRSRRTSNNSCHVEETREALVGESYRKGDFITKVEFSARILFPFIYGIYNTLYIYSYVYKTDPHL